MRLVQVTTSPKNLAEKRRKFDEIEDYLPNMKGCQYEVWYWVEREGWRKWVRFGNESKWCEDPITR
jgi:hypothetical protein